MKAMAGKYPPAGARLQEEQAYEAGLLAAMKGRCQLLPTMLTY